MKRKRGFFFAYLLIAVMLALSLFRVFLTSVKTPTKAFQIPPVWVFKPTSANYLEVFRKQNFELFFKNSVIVTLVSTLVCWSAGISRLGPLQSARPGA